MSITASVVNDTIKLPAGVHLADDTEVVILPKGQAPLKTFAERYARYIGSVDSSLGDLAENHDHYLYGTPKKPAP